MIPENLKEAKELIAKYRSITIEDIEEKFKSIKTDEYKGFSLYSKEIANSLTGFGHVATCLLCGINKIYRCVDCIYQKMNGCYIGDNDKTYLAICHAQSFEELLQAFKDRADHIENLIKKFE